MLDRAIEHPRYQIGVDLDPGIRGAHGGGSQVHEPGRRGADHRHFSGQFFLGDPAVEHIGDRDIGIAPLVTTIRDQRCRIFIHRDAHRGAARGFQFQPFHCRIGCRRVVRIARDNRRVAQQIAHHRQRQRFVILAIVFNQQRYPPRNAVVRVDQRVEMSGTGGGLLKLGEVAAVTDPLRKAYATTAEGPGREHGRRRGPGADATFLAGKVVAENDRPVLDRRGEARIVVQLRAQFTQRCLVARHILQLLLRQSLQRLESGTFVRLGKDDVETHQPDPVLIKQLVHQGRQLVTAPRPPTLLGQRFFIDIKNDYARLDTLRHGQAHFHVIDERVHVIDERNLVNARRMAEQDQKNHESKDVAGKILFQAISRIDRTSGSALEEKLHFGSSQFNHIVVRQLMCLCVERLAIDHRTAGTLHVGDEISVGTARDHRHLNTRLAQRGEGFR